MLALIVPLEATAFLILVTVKKKIIVGLVLAKEHV